MDTLLSILTMTGFVVGALGAALLVVGVFVVSFVESFVDRKAAA